MSIMEVCAHCVFGRSIWPSLISAVSTLALFVAANWELATQYFLIHSPRKMMPSVMANVAYALVILGMPLLPLLASLKGVLKTWAVKQSIQKRAYSATQPRVIQSGSVSILCVCPLFLEVLLPDPIPEDMLRELGARNYNMLPEYPVHFYPLELSAPAGEDTDTDAAANNPIPAAQPINKTIYLQLHENIPMLRSSPLVRLQERELLLALGLAPDYTQLRFLRSRSRFQTIITGMQAGGYGLSVLQRLSQHLAISPLEALVSFFSVIMLVQLLLELYASSHYQRALLLRLNYHQFQRFWTAPRSSLIQSYPKHLKYANYVVGAVYFVLPVYYAVHYIPSCITFHRAFSAPQPPCCSQF